jgi:2-oxoglutarate dehydrogenase E2 component (dihydrolipoamide succinyltransferase)
MATEIIIPAAGESVTEADIVSWYKNDGDYVQMDEPLVELETDKASMDLAAEAPGILKIDITEGTVKVGQVIGSISASDAIPTEPVSSQAEPIASINTNSTSNPEQAHYADGHPSPAAQKQLHEQGISVDLVQGSGKSGRITKQDVLSAAQQQSVKNDISSVPDSISDSTVPSRHQPESKDRRTRNEKLSRLRKTLMTRLVDAQQTTASLTTFNEIDMGAIFDIRKQYKDAFKDKYNVGLGFMSFFTKAACMALQEWPLVNAMIDGDDVQYHDYCDIGVAVSTPKGLVVPVVRDAQTLSFAELESAIRGLALKGRDGKLTLDEMTGGTFTITNGGTFGSMLSTPILNRPQSAILGMHNIVERPVAISGEVKIRPVMYVALTYDHRLIDGREAVGFLVTMKQLLEDPTRLLIQV